MAIIHEIRGVRATLRNGAPQLALRHQARVQAAGGGYVDLDKVTQAYQFLLDLDLGVAQTTTAHWSDVYFGLKVDDANNILTSYCLFGNDAQVVAQAPIYARDPGTNLAFRQWNGSQTALYVPVLDLSNSSEMTTYNHFQTTHNYAMAMELGPDVNQQPGFFVWSGDSAGSPPYFASRLASDFNRYNNRFANDAFVASKVYDFVYAVNTAQDVDAEGLVVINGTVQANNWFSSGRQDLFGNYPNAALYIGNRGSNLACPISGYHNSSFVVPRKLSLTQAQQLSTLVGGWNTPAA